MSDLTYSHLIETEQNLPAYKRPKKFAYIVSRKGQLEPFVTDAPRNEQLKASAALYERAAGFAPDASGAKGHLSAIFRGEPVAVVVTEESEARPRTTVSFAPTREEAVYIADIAHFDAAESRYNDARTDFDAACERARRGLGDDSDVSIVAYWQANHERLHEAMALASDRVLASENAALDRAMERHEERAKSDAMRAREKAAADSPTASAEMLALEAARADRMSEASDLLARIAAGEPVE